MLTLFPAKLKHDEDDKPSSQDAPGRWPLIPSLTGHRSHQVLGRDLLTVPA